MTTFIVSDMNKRFTWMKAARIEGKDPAVWRQDALGKLMRYCDYNNENSEYGWEIYRPVPLSRGGVDNLSNMFPRNIHQ